ncbi:MAG: helix-turn-helix domain-containing protein [Candidatus Acidiferrum sp.]
MIPAIRTAFLNQEKDSRKEEASSNGSNANNQAATTLLACILLLPQETEAVMAILQKLIGTTDSSVPINTTVLHKASSKTASDEEWFNHNEAAAYLGIAKSTLYRYSEQQRIECRKLGGHLEYRRTALDKFKDQHVRPARRTARGECIIPSALSSGK